MNPRVLRSLWWMLALVGVAWWLADSWLLLPQPPLPWAFVRADLWGLPIQALILAAAALLLRRDEGTAALAAVPLVLLLAAALAPAPGVNRAPFAVAEYATALCDGTATGVVTGLAGLALLIAALAATAALITGRLRRVAGAALLAVALIPPVVQLLLHALGVAPLAASRLAWSLVASVTGFGLVWWALPRLAAGGTVAAPGWWEARLLTGLVPAGILLAYVAVKLEAAGLSAGDENIYFYDVLLFTRGVLPYRDYFFAHPPLHVAIPGLLSLVTGFSLGFLKLLPLLFSCGTGLAVWDTARRCFKSGGAVAAAVAMAGFLFALEQLQASSNLTGVNLTVLFAALSLWCVVRGRPLTGGLLAGAAVSTGVYAAPLLAAIPLILAFHDPRGVLRFLGAAVGLAGAINLGFWALGGPAYWDQVYLFHTLKPVHAEQTEAGWLALRGMDWAWLFGVWVVLVVGISLRRPLAERLDRLGLGRVALAWVGAAAAAVLLLIWYRSLLSGEPAGPARVLGNISVFLEGKEFLRTAYYHAGLLLAALLLPLALAVARAIRLPLVTKPGAWTSPALFLLLLLGTVAELAVLRETYSFYYVLLLLPAALAAGATTGLAWDGLRTLARSCSERPTSAQQGLRRGGAALAVTGLVWAASLAPTIALDIGRTRFPQEAKAAGDVSCYPWKESFPDNPFGAAVRARAWRHCRIKGALEQPVTRFLWNKKHHFAKAHEIASYIAENTEDGETLVGASMTTPLLAILSGRDVAAHFVDTNRKRFSSGLATEEDLWEAVCRTPVRYVVASPRSFFTPRRMSRHPVIRDYFKFDKSFNVPALKFSGRYPLVLFRRVADAPDDEGCYCRYPPGERRP